MALAAPSDTGSAVRPDPVSARVTGLLYLGLAISGMVSFLVIRPRLFDPDDPAATLARLLDHETLARIGIASELVLVVTQALTALWFYRLFRRVDPFTAGAIAVFGTVNAVAILGSAAFLATALDTALDPVGEDTSQLMYLISENLWSVGGLFFGLWLIPMGLVALRSGWTPRPLGWLLVASGVGYLLNTFLTHLAPSAELLAELVVLPATVGEFWMIGWLLFRGLRRRT
ncbi:DUF4386 domain-containing protein [Streptomyces sp. JNUCC 64]